MEVLWCFLEHLRSVGRKILGGQDTAAFPDFLLDEFRYPALAESRRALIGDETQRSGEFGEVEDGGAAELTVDPGKLSAGAEVEMEWRITANERMDFADVEQLVPGHGEASFSQPDRGLQDTDPVEVSPALVDFPQGDDGARNACSEMPFFCLESLCPRGLVVLEATRFVDFEHVLAGSGRCPQITVDRHQSTFSCVEAGKARIAADAALGRFDDKTREGGGDDGIEGIASGLEKSQSGPDRVRMSGGDHAVGSMDLAAVHCHGDVPHPAPMLNVMGVTRQSGGLCPLTGSGLPRAIPGDRGSLACRCGCC